MATPQNFNIYLLLLVAVCATGCGIFSSNSDSVNCNPELVCTNAVSGQWTYLGLEGEAVSSILVDACNPTVILAGTGMNFSEGRTGKIFRSEDCGNTWQQTYIGGSFHGFTQDPNNPSNIYAWDSTPDGDILRSRDNGRSWSVITEDLNPSGNDRAGPMLVNPQNSNHLIASKGSFMSGQLYQSFNGGQTWNLISEDLEAPVSSSGAATVLYVHPSEPKLFFAAMYPSGRILRSEDAGKNWQITEENYGVFQNITTDPGHPNMLYAITSSITRPDYKGPVFISEDWGKNWSSYGISSDTLHAHRDIKVFEKESIYLATSSGVLKLNNQNHIWLNNGLETYNNASPEIFVIQVNPQNSLMYAGMFYTDYPQIYKGGIYVRKIR